MHSALEPSGTRPALPVNQDNAFWLAGVRDGRLLIQRCDDCETLRHPPAPMCGACRSLRWSAIAASGRGRIYSYAVHHRPEMPGFPRPFVIVLVELEEGTRLIGNLVGTPPEECRIDLPVEVVFAPDEASGELWPHWRAIPGGAA